MTIGAPRFLLVSLAALFSSYHIVLGVYSFQLGFHREVAPVIAAMVLAVSLYASVDLLPPIMLLALLERLKRIETEPPTIVLRGWMIPVRRASVASLAVIAVAFPVGNATGQVVAATAGAIVVGAGVFWGIVRRSASHRVVVA